MAEEGATDGWNRRLAEPVLPLRSFATGGRSRFDRGGCIHKLVAENGDHKTDPLDLRHFAT
jgi:hypothetical protein